MWIGDSASRHPEKLPLFFQRLREMGINTAMVYGAADPQPIVESNFSYYVENMVNRGLCLKFNSKVVDWDKTVMDWAHNGRPDSALVRDYCLDDPAWLDSARSTLSEIVHKNAPHHPIAYNIRDELSVTISANPFDYDFNPVALEGFRTWLKTRYASVTHLNAEWGTTFNAWSEVRPFTTDQIKNRMVSGEAVPRGQPDWQRLQQIHFAPASARENPMAWNFSPWADFRTYMDISLARALDSLRQAARSVDPATPVGIEGTQMPSAFGGYDLWRLAHVLDWVEPYDIGCAREVFGSFMPGKPILTTVFESETKAAQRRLWHLLLEGDRGCLIWWSEDCIDWKEPDLQLTRKAKALTPVMRQMTSPLAGLFLRARREEDLVFIHYSQASIQVDWLIESTADGSTWLRRFSSFESEHNRMAKTRDAWLKSLQDLGYSPRFLSSEQMETGALAAVSNSVLVLPESSALSEKEWAAIENALHTTKNNGGDCEVFADGPAGCFDEHGRLREKIPHDTLAVAVTNLGTMVFKHAAGVAKSASRGGRYLQDRLTGNSGSAWLEWIKEQLGQREQDIVVPASARARVHRFRLKSSRLLAIERNVDYHMSEELKQAGGNEALEKMLVTEAVLREPAHVYDLRERKYLGLTDRIKFTLDPWQPSLFALLRRPVPEDTVLTELMTELEP